MGNSSISITLHPPGHAQPIDVQLDAEGTLYWPQAHTLFLADPHFGKEASFHHAGIAIPDNILQHDLNRLSRLIATYQAQRLIILGDFFHTVESQNNSIMEQLIRWRRQHKQLDIALIPGNHDLHAGPPPAELAIDELPVGTELGPFHLLHAPCDQSCTLPEGYTLTGHLHPTVTLRGRDGSSLRAPCFAVGPTQTVLPAFGTFTGGMRYPATSAERIFVTGEGEILEIVRTQTSKRPNQGNREP